MIVVLIGAPGAGKGTQCDLLAKQKKLRKLSTGDLLRKQIADDTKLGRFAKDIIARGELLPDDVLLDLVKEGLAEERSENGVLLDGYPRTLKQADDLVKLVGNKLTDVVHVDVEEPVLVRRLSGREICGQCGASYHDIDMKSHSSGICDRCQGPLVRRPDDRPDKILKRLQIYREETEPVVMFFKSIGLYRRVDGSGSSENVLERILKVLVNNG